MKEDYFGYYYLYPERIQIEKGELVFEGEKKGKIEFGYSSEGVPYGKIDFTHNKKRFIITFHNKNCIKVIEKGKKAEKLPGDIPFDD